MLLVVLRHGQVTAEHSPTRLHEPVAVGKETGSGGLLQSDTVSSHGNGVLATASYEQRRLMSNGVL